MRWVLAVSDADATVRKVIQVGTVIVELGSIVREAGFTGRVDHRAAVLRHVPLMARATQKANPIRSRKVAHLSGFRRQRKRPKSLIDLGLWNFSGPR